ncbi:heavy metal translocating P-type ATPase [Furfurilactobacillus siliginis]|uniref:heavy metal translocating P-type ATPase n=1 Tax=Furfurilactobacillus siliginis TaxID=348151 RepID=UPI0007107879|nr:heavy metal translocating P-type ATPase [Furfurilactobacillus siliginis]
MKMTRWIQKHLNNITLATGFLIAGGFILKWLQQTAVSSVFLIIASVIAATPIIMRAWAALRLKTIGIELLVSIAVVGAFVIGEYDESAIVTFLFLFGAYLENKTLAKTRQSIKSLTEMAPTTANVVSEDGTVVSTDVDLVDKGDIVLVKTGDQIPVDGVITDGTAYVNEASVTGEARLVAKGMSDTVFAGTMVDNGSIFMEATKVGDDTTFAKIIELVEEAQDVKSPAEKFIDRFATYYTPAVLVIALLVWVGFRDFRLAITVLVLGCPGALVIGAPVSNVAGIGNGAKHGVLIKGGDVINTFSHVDTLVFDKTGTLTQGKTAVSKVITYGDATVALAAATALEKNSTHPLGQALVSYAQTQGWSEQAKISDVDVIKGQGIKAHVDDEILVVGNQLLMATSHIMIDADQQDDINALQAAGNSIILIAMNQQLIALVGVTDIIRPDVATSLQALKATGVKRTIMLTGDNTVTAQAIGQQAGIDEVHAEMLPADKAAFVKGLQETGAIVAFVGDGINDSPSLATADIGIAMGSGTDVAVDTSDVVLMQSSFPELVHAYGLAKKTVGNTRMNIVIAVGTVALLLFGLLAGVIYMASGMFVHEASILVVILNAMRLLSYHPKVQLSVKKAHVLDLNQGHHTNVSVH